MLGSSVFYFALNLMRFLGSRHLRRGDYEQHKELIRKVILAKNVGQRAGRVSEGSSPLWVGFCRAHPLQLAQAGLQHSCCMGWVLQVHMLSLETQWRQSAVLPKHGAYKAAVAHQA